MKPTKLRSCLEFISSLVKNYFRVDLSSLGAANSGLFARTKRIKMPERILNKQKSPIKYILAVNSRQLLTTLALAVAVLLGACTKTSNSYIIEGKLSGIEQGTEIHLFSNDEKILSPIATTQLENGRFRFEVEALPDTTLFVQLVIG